MTAVSGQAPTPRFQKTAFESLPAVVLSNTSLALTIVLEGGAFAKLVFPGVPEAVSPLWDPARAAREAGEPPRSGGSRGHFVCVDGFGSPSAEERAAGLPGHGEAHLQPWEVVSSEQEGRVLTVRLRARLPLVREVFTRTIRMVDGESVIYVQSELESLAAFDRPISWAEHATIGAPFLERSVTVVDVSGSRAITRPYEARAASGRRLASGKEFTWPIAPARDGTRVDLRAAPDAPGSTDIVTIALDSTRESAFVAAVNPRRRLVFGYVFRPSEYPWLQDWQSFQNPITMARGMEFSTQPFGLSRRDVVDLHSLLGRPAFRWLPAKSAIGSSFIMFYTCTPPGFAGVSDVKSEGGRLVLEDRSSKQQVVLAASLFEQVKGDPGK